MSKMHLLSSEIVPSDEELRPYDGLRNIRYRKEGELAIGLFLRANTDRPVLTVLSPNTEGPVLIEVEPDHANEAFEEPWSHAGVAGQMAIEEALAPEVAHWAA